MFINLEEFEIGCTKQLNYGKIIFELQPCKNYEIWIVVKNFKFYEIENLKVQWKA